VAHAAETAELLNVELDDLAWFLALVAWMWLLQLEAREPAVAAAFENARDAGFGDADLGCDVLLGAAATSGFPVRTEWTTSRKFTAKRSGAGRQIPFGIT
jgi:hypothetical protein